MGKAQPFRPLRWLPGAKEVVLSEPLWQICREKKEKLRLRNEDIAMQGQVSVNAVAQFLRGETKNISLAVAAAVCRALHVSLDRHYEIVPDDVSNSGAVPQTVDEAVLRVRLEKAEAESLIYKKITYFLAGIVALALVALLVDLTVPGIGWVRA